MSPGRPELCNSNCIEYLIDDSIGRVTGYVIGNIPGYPGSDLSRTIPACTWLENNVNLLDSDRFLRTIESPRLCAVEPRFFFTSYCLAD